MHVDNKRKNISVLCQGPTQGLDNTTIKAEAKYPIKFTKSGKKVVKTVLKRKQYFFFC